ncbi:armadillo-type protein [Flammula alnicola]|nr:armadillo-type protein [Flammula alnicola]
MHESSCIALLERNIFNLLLEYIPGRDSQLQSQALGIFPAFIEYGKAQSSDVNSLGDTTYDPSILVPWIEDIFGLFLAAMVKSQQLNVQEATISALSSYLQYDYTRAEFLRLDHLTVLLQMLEINDNSDLQLAAIAVLKVLLSHNDAQEALDQKQFSHTLAWTLKTCTYHTKKNVLEFFLYCLTFANDDLKENLLQEFIDPLTELFTTENTVSELMEKIFMVFYVISTHETTCKILLSSDSILHLLNTVKKPESYTSISIDLSQRTLINVLKNKHKLPTFSGRVLDDAQKPFICQGFVYTIAELLEDGDPALQLFSMDLLFHCLTYYDLRQLLYNSKVILILGHKLSCGGFHVQKATLNILLILIGYEDLRSAVIRSTIVAPLLDIVWKDWSQLSDPSLKLLTICMKQSRYPVSLLPDNALDILADLLQSSNNHALLAAITIIMECTQLVHFKHNNSILDFVSLHVVKQITNIFSSTTQLVLQDKAAEALHHFANNDHLRLMLATNEFYSSIFQALMSSDPSFQSSALEILLVLSKFNETSLLLSKESYITVLMDLLAICDVNMQVLILKIITNLTHFKNIHGILLLHNIFDNLYIFGMYPDIELAKTVMELFEKLVIYDNFRYKMDVIAFMRMALHLLHSRNLQLQQIACHTFSCLIVHNDIHNKIICPDIVILIYGELHQNFGPLEPPQSLTSNERLYLLKLLNIMQEASPSAVQDLIQEFFPPISPSNLYITFQHAALDFPSDQNSYQSEDSYSTHQDSDSEILHINSV